MNTRESPVLKGCLDLLRASRVFAWRNNTMGVFDPETRRFRAFIGLKGVSDILGILPSGRFLAVETKRPAMPGFGIKAGRPTPEQRAFLETVNDHGGVGVVVSDVASLADILAILSEDSWAQFTSDGHRREG